MAKKLNELLYALPFASVLGDVGAQTIQKIEFDSRKAGKNDLFVCLPGVRFDGHSFAAAVYQTGCRAFLCEHPIDALPPDAVQIVTDNTRRDLAILAKAFYDNASDRLSIIGITGTKGKTSTALMIAAILNGCGVSCAYIGSNGVIINGRHEDTVNTTPESLTLHRFFQKMVEEGVTHVVMEVSSQALAHYRVRGLSFEEVIFTNLSVDHIGTGEHATFEEYRDAKRSLFADYPSRTVIVNADDAYAGEILAASHALPVRYAIHTPADFTAHDITPFRSETSLGIDFVCQSGTHETPVRLRTPGDFSVYNGLCAIAAASVLGIDAEQCAAILKTTSITGRFEIVDAIEGVTFLLDYAHNGFSLTNALHFLRAYRPKRLICVFGSIGGRAQNRRRELAEASAALADYSIITSDNPDFEDPEEIIRDILTYFDPTKPHEVVVDRGEAVRRAVRIAEKGDIVLFAGKGHETYQLIRGKKEPFSERALILSEAKARQENAAEQVSGEELLLDTI